MLCIFLSWDRIKNILEIKLNKYTGRSDKFSLLVTHRCAVSVCREFDYNVARITIVRVQHVRNPCFNNSPPPRKKTPHWDDNKGSLVVSNKRLPCNQLRPTTFCFEETNSLRGWRFVSAFTKVSLAVPTWPIPEKAAHNKLLFFLRGCICCRRERAPLTARKWDYEGRNREKR